MLVEIKITYDPSQESFEQALASLSQKANAGSQAPYSSNVYGLATHKDSVPEVKSDELPGQMSLEDVKTEEQSAPEAPAETQKQVTKTDIRAIATAVSKAGKKAELKAALEAFGATKLSDVNEADYPALKERLEAINA